MKYINFSDEDFQRANTIDLARYLQSKGERLKKVGSTYQYIYTDGSGTHDSVTISGAKWYDHKNQRGGYAVRFLQEFFGMSFQEAMLELLGGHTSAVEFQPSEKPAAKPFVLPEPNKDMRRVFAYLSKQRFIAPDVISHFAHEKKLFEDKKYHNVVFVGTDENGVPKQASVRSAISFGKPFRITVAGSDTRYSFSHFGVDEKLYVFEAPIDMLSFITLYPKDWRQHSYIAMNGVYESAVLNVLESHSQLEKLYLCTDNDEGGIEAAERLRDILSEHVYSEIYLITPEQKDWNEVLKEQNDAEFLPAVPHKRKEKYLEFVSALGEVRINANRISADLISIYNSADYVLLAEFSLAASEHFMRISGEEFPLEQMKSKLSQEYKCYLDKGGLPVKSNKLKSAVNAGVELLRARSQTAYELKMTAKKFYEIADFALRLAAEESLIHQNGQRETPEKSPDEEPRAVCLSM